MGRKRIYAGDAERQAACRLRRKHKAAGYRDLVILGEALDVLRSLPANSVDSGVTDAPWGIGFMSKAWDAGLPAAAIWREVYRVLKPGAYLLAFGGTRTYHRLACAVEDAGFEIRDMISWLYASGWPKSRDIAKDFDRMAGAERPVVGRHVEGSVGYKTSQRAHGAQTVNVTEFDEVSKEPISDLAKQWEGWGTALKPAQEPIVVARKPFKGSTAANVAKWGTGAMNIDASRVPTSDKLGGGAETSDDACFKVDGWERPWMHDAEYMAARKERIAAKVEHAESLGRWPANVIVDGSDEVRAHLPGGAARYFYCAKPSRKEREKGLEGLPERAIPFMAKANGTGESSMPEKNGRARANHHPTVKPLGLMTYLVKLVTPPGGLVLDPFYGSGSTGLAARAAGFGFLGIERDADYVEIARARRA